MKSIAQNGVWDINTDAGKKNLAAEKKIMITAIALTGKCYSKRPFGFTIQHLFIKGKKCFGTRTDRSERLRSKRRYAEYFHTISAVLDAFTYLYKRVCPSVSWSIGW